MLPSQQKITALAQSLWDQAGFGLVVATLPLFGNPPSKTMRPNSIGSWGIGKKATDEGALVLLSLDPRRVRIEVGSGAEGYLNDAKAGRILDNYGIPFLKTGDFSPRLLRFRRNRRNRRA